MDYVTKKEFESALAILDRALKNGQVEEGQQPQSGESTPLVSVFFSYNESGEYPFKPEQCGFVASDLAAKKKLHSLRLELKLHRENVNSNQKSLERLEKEEQALMALLPKLKE